jgi:hypothetical protein
MQPTEKSAVFPLFARAAICAALGILMMVSHSSSAAAQCVGDCNGDGEVTVDEILIGVNIALGSRPVGDCPSFDANMDGQVTVDEIIQATNNALSGCPADGPEATFPTSLHALRTGKETFYSAANGGFETLTNVAYDELDCAGCHAPTLADGTPVDPETYEPSCADCHANPEEPSEGITDELCLGCHSRQQVEKDFFADYHRDQLGFTCMSCHSTDEMHGDGTTYVSHLETPGPQCEDCHSEDGIAGAPSSNTAHIVHSDTGKLDCSACHVKSVVSCYSCHFESEVAGAGKRFFAPPRRDFKFLMNFRDKVYPASFQSLVYQGQSFYVLAPYYAHSVTSEVSCSDCHANAAVTEYGDEGTITVTKYVDGALQGPSGVIPVPPDWETALLLDFLDYTGDPTTPIPETDPALWQFLKTGADLTQMLFGEPLTEQQMQKLSLDVGP